MTSVRINVLLVEDNLGDAQLAKDMLAYDGGGAFDVIHVQTLEEAIRSLESNPAIGLVLLDLGLPDETGLQTLRRIIPHAQHASVVVITGHRDEEMGIAAIREGAHDFITKGQIDGAQLRRILRYALERQDMQTALRVEMDRRAAAQTALQLSEERYRLLSETAPMGLLLCNELGKIADANGELLRLFRYSREQLVGQPVEILLPERVRDAHQRLRHSYMRRPNSRRMGSETELLGRKSDGTEFPVEINVGPVTTAEGTFFSVTIVDITSQNKLEEQLRCAQRTEAVGKLAGGVAHDFNNLLAVIVGCSDFVLEVLPAAHPASKKVEMIKKAGASATDLTRQLLAFSQQEVILPRVLDLKEIVDRTETLLRRLIGDQIDLKVFVEPALGHVKADQGQIEQIILNLAINARDAMPQGGKLTIEARNSEIDFSYQEKLEQVVPGRYVVLSVEDTGCGMDRQTQSRIFDPYFTTKESGKGTGLGLATVYGIAKQCGGYIWVNSQVNRGTSFKVYLPRVKQEVQREEEEAPKTGPVRYSETILIAEDSDSVREVVGDFLESKGYLVLGAASGDAALKTAKGFGGAIDLLLTDVVMPGIGGVELARQLKVLRPRMKVIFTSGDSDDTQARQGGLDSTRVFIQKPFRPKTLAKKIRQVLDEPDRTAGNTRLVQAN